MYKTCFSHATMQMYTILYKHAKTSTVTKYYTSWY